MKASDSVEKFKPTLRMYANFAARTIKKVCSEIGPRETGSEAELKAQNYMAEQVGDAADEVKQDEFRLSPRAFLGWLRIAGIILIVLTAIQIANIFTPDVLYAPYIAYVAIAVIAVMIIGEFLFYRQPVDPFFPKATSHNTYCIRKATGETKRRIVICGHSDSSIEWRFTWLGGNKLLYGAFAYPIIGFAYTIFVTIITTATQKPLPVLYWIGLAFIPGYVMLSIFMNYKITVDGANDNLTGCMAGAAVLKFLGDNNIHFENTEVVAMFSGGEEAGLRGAKAMVKQHPEYKDGKVETVVLAFDTLKDYDDMAIYDKDMSGITKHDRRACALLKAAGDLSDVDLPYAVLFCGASDAAAVTQGGIPAACFAAMNPGPPRYYHTRGDVADIMELKTIEKGIEIALNSVFLFDEQGLKLDYDGDGKNDEPEFESVGFGL